MTRIRATRWIGWAPGWVAMLAGAALLVAACGGRESADPGTARDHVSTSLPRIVDSATRSTSFLAEEGTVMDDLSQGMSSLNASYPALPFQFPFAESAYASTKRAIRSHLPGGEDSPGEAIARFLNERIFIDANYEGDGVYLLRGEVLCDGEDGLPDLQCVADVNRAQLRLRAEVSGDELLVTLLVGPDRDAPIELSLSPDRIEIAADLAEARSAIVWLASIEGEDVSLPAVMEGKVSASLTRNGDADVTVAAAIERAVRVEGTLDGGAGAYAFSSARKDPLLAVRAQGIERRLTIDLDVGETIARVPWGIADEESTIAGTLGVESAGLSGSVVLEEGARTLALTNLGLGDGTTRIKLDDTTLVAIDLNAAAGRRFALTVTPQPDGLPTFRVDPLFDLEIALHLAPLAAAGEVVDSWLLDETYRITFDGAAPTAQPVLPPFDGEGGLAIRSGTLTIASTGASAPVVVSAGQCLLGDEVTSGEHPLLGAFAAGPCP